MKQEIKVGAWVKQLGWDKFYEVMSVFMYELILRTDKGEYPYKHYRNQTWIIKEKEQQLNKIEMNRKYRRVGTHEPVRVICVDRKDKGIPCIGLYDTGLSEGVCYFDHQGYDPLDGKQIIEEIPAVDWSKVEIDTLIWVDGCPRYFSSYVDGKVHYFRDGTTSKTNINGPATISEEVCSLEEPR